MNKFRKISAGLAAVILLFASFAFIPKAFAGTLNNVSVVENGTTPMIAATGSSIVFEFTTVSSVTTPTVTLTFTGWTGGSAGSVNAAPTLLNDGSCSSYFSNSPVAFPGSPTASGNAGTGVITMSSGGTLAATTSYCAKFTSSTAVTNPTSVGSYNVVVSDGTDSQTVTIAVLTSGGNSYTVNAQIGSTFTMSIGGAGQTDNFSGQLSSSAVSVTPTGITTTVSTNAKTGWFVWVKDANAGLTSTNASKTIASVATGSNQVMNTGKVGTEAYAIGATTGTGSPTIAAAYAYSAGTAGGGLSSTVYNTIAYNTVPSSGNTFKTNELADISATTPPAVDYNDTITEIGAGSF